MTESVVYKGKKLPLAKRVRLCDLIRCLISKSPPVEPRFYRFLEIKNDRISKSDLSKYQEEIFYYLANGELIAQGVTGEYYYHYDFSESIGYDIHPIKDSKIQILDSAIWDFEAILWEHNTLITSEIIEAYDHDLDVISRSSGTCFIDIDVDIKDVAKIWPELLQSPPIDDMPQDNSMPEPEQGAAQAEIKELRDEIERLKKENAALNKKETSDRKTLLKIILAMAVDAYKYNHKLERNSATAKIATATQKLATDTKTPEMELSDDTILNKLKDAKELLLS
ncbi:MAG: hypothetical protein EAZ52_07755 [Alphaproteobacteria bacterium]|nr:MAG: hypothetical protein EAZ52_07755 [Alphaproteobacteria bacterium]